MKKSLIALAVMAAAGAASAQSSVTLFGIVDANYNYVKGDGNGHVSRLTDSGYNSSRLGFRGTEDLGGGMSASFWLEAGLNNDNGTGDSTNTNNQAVTTSVGGAQGLVFNRRSTVSLAGGWGELRLGRDYVPTFWNLTIFDPFGTNGVGASSNMTIGAGLGTTGSAALTTAVRASNSIGYFLPPNLGGFYGQAMYAFGENASNAGATADDGNHWGLRLGFASGPFNVALGYTRTNFAVGDVEMMNIGGQWDFGMARLMAQYVNDEAVGTDGRGWLVGALVPVGAGEIRASYSQYRIDAGADPRVRKLALGYVHNLSKRTAVYTTVARVRNNGGSAVALGGATTSANSSSTGFDIGVRHSF